MGAAPLAAAVDNVGGDPYAVARACGARCDECALHRYGKGGPVYPETKPNARFVIIGQEPGHDEVLAGRPQVGKSGQYLTDELAALGVRRSEYDLDNVLLCRSNVEGDLGAFQRKLRRVNRLRAAKGKPELLDPVHACLPRLRNSLTRYQRALVLGGPAARAVIPGHTGAITDTRGSTITVKRGTLPPLRVVAAMSPAAVLRELKWRFAFRADLQRAKLFFEGRLTWKDAPITFKPSPAQIREFLDTKRMLSWDLETETKKADNVSRDHIFPKYAEVQLIGIGDANGVLSIPFTFHGQRFYTAAEEREIRGILRHWFQDKRRPKIGHNSGYYDTLVIWYWLGVRVEGQLDTIMLGHQLDSELPRSLYYLGTTKTAVHNWKAGDPALTAQSIKQLVPYNRTDVQVVAVVAPGMIAQIRAGGPTQIELCKLEHADQQLAVDMHIVGMPVDQDVRRGVELDYTEQAREALALMRKLCERPDFNPQSVPQLCDVLYEQFQLPILDFTDTGDPATGMATIRALLRENLPKHAEAFLWALRDYRDKVKVLGTYLRPMAPGVLGENRCVLYPDGRIHPIWNAHKPTTGRYASEGPNAQNIPVWLRKIIRAEPGFAFVACDQDQVELRLAAGRWGADRYLEAFETHRDVAGKRYRMDPHQITMHLIWGDSIWKLPGAPPPEWKFYKSWPGGKIGGKFSEMRDLGKRVQFAGQYGAVPKTMLEVIRSAKAEVDVLDEQGRPVLRADGTVKKRVIFPYLNMTEEKVAEMRERWLENCSAFPGGWERELQHYRDHGYVEEPITHRRRYFLNGEEESRNEIINFPIQSSAAAIMNLIGRDLRAEFPIDYAGVYVAANGDPLHTGVCNQSHDELTLLTRVERAKADAARMQELFTRRFPCYNVNFGGEARHGVEWKEAG